MTINMFRKQLDKMANGGVLMMPIEFMEDRIDWLFEYEKITEEEKNAMYDKLDTIRRINKHD